MMVVVVVVVCPKVYNPEIEAPLLEAASRSFFDVPPHEKKLLLLQKLQLCSIRFDWSDPRVHAAERELKSRTLRELVSVSHHMTELNDCRSFKDVLRMIGDNLFRELPSITGEAPADTDDEDVNDPAWVHLEHVYVRRSTTHCMHACLSIECTSHAGPSHTRGMGLVLLQLVLGVIVVGLTHNGADAEVSHRY